MSGLADWIRSNAFPYATGAFMLIGGSGAGKPTQAVEFERVTTPGSGMTISLPATWRLATLDGGDGYADDATPQYQFMISNLGTRVFGNETFGAADSIEQAVQLKVDQNPAGKNGKVQTIGPGRVLAYSLGTVGDPGFRKDDRHWWLVEERDDGAHLALFTLSVLADHAKREDTEAQVQLLTSQIKEASFPTSPASEAGEDSR